MAKNKSVKFEGQSDEDKELGTGEVTRDVRAETEELTDEEVQAKLDAQEDRKEEGETVREGLDLANGVESKSDEPAAPAVAEQSVAEKLSGVVKPSPSKISDANDHLTALVNFFGKRKDDLITKHDKVHPTHLQMVKELFEKREKNSAKNKFHLSDGNIELLANLHKRLIK
jgi:hypothetical protein